MNPSLFHSCVNTFCQKTFEVSVEDRLFYAKFDVPLPKLCPDCRQIRRLAFRNERKLYRPQCGLCQKTFISIYSATKPYPVYCPECWWSDRWDPMNYGKKYDFSRSFFEQFKELWETVPKLGILMLKDCINSQFAHDVYRVENCYLVFDGAQAKDCYFGETFLNLKDCADFLFLQNSELCYEIINCSDCYNVQFSRYCQNCSDSRFLLACKGCRNCFGCVNLRQKEYHIFNTPYSKEEYEKIIASFGLSSRENLHKARQQAEDFFNKFPVRAMHGNFNEEVSGDNLIGCKNTHESFDCSGLRDCKFCTNLLEGGQDCYDVNVWGGKTSLVYNSAGIGGGCENVIGSYYVCFSASNVFHSAFCLNNNKNLLGCVGLRQKEYCILNTHYAKEEYEKLAPLIIEQMKNTAEWGEFFPPSLSAFGYNETVAHEYFPLTKEQAKARGFLWHEEPGKSAEPQVFVLADDISQTPDSLLHHKLVCEKCGKNYKVIAQELKLYRQIGVPVPKKCPDCRHLCRMLLRNPRKLLEKSCSLCGKKILTSHANEHGKIYCEQCYNSEVA